MTFAAHTANEITFVQLIEKLIELGKTPYFDVMFYPKENHSFTHAESWTDEYERILSFFDRHLK